MDILSKLPVEIAYQILGTLDIKDLVACQCVSRQWYRISIDQSVWKNIFLEYERPFAIPFSYSSSSPGNVPSIARSQSPESSAVVLDLDGIPTEVSEEETESTTGAIVYEKDWKQQCRARVISDRNWKKGHIQSLFTLNVHRGAIVRLRIKDGTLLSGDIFGQVAVWDTGTWRCKDVIDAAVGPIQLLDFSAAAMVATVISKSGICRIWNLTSKTMMHSSSALDVTCMTMDDHHLVLGKRDSRIELVDFMTGHSVGSTNPFPGETLQDLYIQNDTLIVATGHRVRIMSTETLAVLLSCPLPISSTLHTFCSVFHIRSLILLTDQHLLHIAWDPLYKSPNKDFIIDNRLELPPDLSKAPSVHRTKIPPIASITSIAIGGNHPHVLTTNADRPSLNETIRVCPTTSSLLSPAPTQEHDVEIDEEASDILDMPVTTEENNSDGMAAEDVGIVLTSQVDEIARYLDTCGLKPSFMDVDEDNIIIGTSKGDIVVLGMMPQEG
ncbi:hypothetical protein BGX28_002069 [Mortierella sp. GBA30]|nr:hypothetical protein BGX28_002069 [Mortierella sp. GBA30]